MSAPTTAELLAQLRATVETDAAKRLTNGLGGPHMERRYWLTAKGYAALAQAEEPS